MQYHSYLASLSGDERVEAEVVNDAIVSLIIAEEPHNVTNCRFFMSAEMARKIAAALLAAADDVSALLTKPTVFANGD